MNAKIEGMMSILVAFLLLLSMMLNWDTRITGGIAIVVLIGLAIYQFTRTTATRK